MEEEEEVATSQEAYQASSIRRYVQASSGRGLGFRCSSARPHLAAGVVVSWCLCSSDNHQSLTRRLPRCEAKADDLPLKVSREMMRPNTVIVHEQCGSKKNQGVNTRVLRAGSCHCLLSSHSLHSHSHSP